MEKKYPFLPTDDQVSDWYVENIDYDCSASSAIYKFRLWLKSLIPEQINERKDGGIAYIACALTDPAKCGTYLSIDGSEVFAVRKVTMQGPIWVKASERLPKSWNRLYVRFVHTRIPLVDPENWLKDNERAIHDVEWLDESGGERP